MLKTSIKIFYIKFIQKILSLKLNSVTIKIKIEKFEPYGIEIEKNSEDELRKICNNINCLNMENVFIYK